MKSNNPFCNACTEPDCLVSLDDTCAMIRAYKTSTTIGIDSEIEEQTDALIADLQGQILDLQQQLNDVLKSSSEPAGYKANPILSILKGATPEYLYAYAEETPLSLFRDAMARKLSEKRNQGKDGWYRPDCSIDLLTEMLKEHVEKGDMVDVANFAMMIECKKAMGHQ